MTKVTSLAALAAVDADTANDLVTVVDVSETGAARNKKMTFAAFKTAIAGLFGALAVKSSVNDGDWSGTDLALGNGGTGASSAPAARTNLDVYSKAEVDAIAVGGGYTNEQAQDAVGAMVDGSLTYVDGTPLLQRAALTGDVTAAAGSNALTIAADAVTYAKMQNVSATDKLLGRSSAGAGDIEEITCTPFARTFLDDANAAAVRATLGTGTGSGDMVAANNLSDLASAPTARTNLGLLRLIAFFFTTAPTASEVLALYIAADAFTIPANMAGSQVSVGTNPAATFAIDVQKNGSTIATISISTGGVATLTTTSGTSKAIAAGDIIKFVAPGSADAAVANVAVTVKGTL